MMEFEMGGTGEIQLRELVSLVGIVGGYNLAAWRLKKAITKIERTAHPWRLQLRDFTLVREARERATDHREIRRLTRLLWAMFLVAVSGPFVLIAWIAFSAVSR